TSSHHDAGEVEQVTGDLADQELLRAAVRGCQAVVHCAAVSGVNKVLDDPELAETVNAGGTRAVLEAARREDVGRMVYASTIWAYGDSNGHGPIAEGEALS